MSSTLDRPSAGPGRRWGRRTGRQRVLDLVRDQVGVESGSLAGFGSPSRVAVLVHWSRSPVLSRSFTTLAGELDRSGHQLVVVSTCESPAHLEWGGRLPRNAVVLRRPNFGYDFGSWATALDLLPAIARADSVILANDSLVGPFAALDDVMARVDTLSPDVVGLTDVRQYFRHLQSYFLRFAGGILADPPLARFYGDVRIEPTKWDVIRRYELGLTKLFRAESYGFGPVFRADEFVAAGENPVIRGWWRLLERGFPFVKREIIRRPEVAPRSAWIGPEVLALYGHHIEEWV